MLFGIVLVFVAPIIYFIPVLIRQTSETYILLQNFDLTNVLNMFMKESTSTIISKNISNVIYNTSVAFQKQFLNIFNVNNYLLTKGANIYKYVWGNNVTIANGECLSIVLPPGKEITIPDGYSLTIEDGGDLLIFSL